MKHEEILNLADTTEKHADEFCERWWETIADNDNFDPYTDEDQSELDGIIGHYNTVVSALIAENEQLQNKLAGTWR